MLTEERKAPDAGGPGWPQWPAECLSKLQRKAEGNGLRSQNLSALQPREEDAMAGKGLATFRTLRPQTPSAGPHPPESLQTCAEMEEATECAPRCSKN